MRYWAKYRKDHISGVGRIHLLPCHLLDVAAVGYLMVTNNLFGAADTLKQVGLEGESGVKRQIQVPHKRQEFGPRG